MLIFFQTKGTMKHQINIMFVKSSPPVFHEPKSGIGNLSCLFLIVISKADPFIFVVRLRRVVGLKEY